MKEKVCVRAIEQARWRSKEAGHRVSHSFGFIIKGGGRRNQMAGYSKLACIQGAPSN